MGKRAQQQSMSVTTANRDETIRSRSSFRMVTRLQAILVDRVPVAEIFNCTRTTATIMDMAAALAVAMVAVVPAAAIATTATTGAAVAAAVPTTAAVPVGMITISRAKMTRVIRTTEIKETMEIKG